MTPRPFSAPSRDALIDFVKAFEAAHRNGNKAGLDAAELSRALHQIGLELKVADCARLVVLYDPNNNGHIPYHQFVRMMAASAARF